MSLKEVNLGPVNIMDFNEYLVKKNSNYNKRSAKVSDAYIDFMLSSDKIPKDVDSLRQYGITQEHIENYVNKTILDNANPGRIENPLERILRYNSNSGLNNGFNLDRPKDMHLAPHLDSYLKDIGPDIKTVMDGTRERYTLNRVA